MHAGQHRTRAPDDDGDGQCERAPVPAGAPGERERAGAEGHGQAHAVDAEHGRIAGQPAVCLAGTEQQPGEAGHQPASDPLDQHPGTRQYQQEPGGAAAFRVAADDERAQGGRDQRQREDEDDGERAGERCYGSAEEMQAVVDPVDPGAPEANAEQPAAPDGAAAGAVLPQEEQHGRAGDGERPKVPGGEGERERCASQQREKIACTRAGDCRTQTLPSVESRTSCHRGVPQNEASGYRNRRNRPITRTL